MASTAAITASMVQSSFDALDRQRELISSCTHLWKELSDHFASLDQHLQIKADALLSKNRALDLKVQQALDSLHRREASIGPTVEAAISKLDSLGPPPDPPGDDLDLADKLRALCARMDSDGFFDLVVSKRKETDLLRSAMPAAIEGCVDPARFVIEVVIRVFPVDKREVKTPPDLGWACVLILEAAAPALLDPELGTERLLVTRSVKEKAREMAEEWKEGLEKRGGVEGGKPQDVHAFLQLVVTFGIVAKEDRELYRRLVLGFAWRRQMPRLALGLGLEDQMEDMIKELIGKRQQLDAINFAYEAGLQDKFPPIPLLKSFLKNSKKAASSVSEDHGNSGQAVNQPNRKEQSAIRAVMKCIEDRKLEADFPLEGLQKRLENLEKARVEKKKPSPGPTAPANKRTRANNGGPMPPAKAGRLTNNAYVSSFPAAPTFVRSPSSHTTYSAAVLPPYPYDRPVGHGVYGSRSPPAIRDPYGYPAEEVSPAAIAASYQPAPMNYPAYGAYSNGMGAYGNGMAPGYHQAYYR